MSLRAALPTVPLALAYDPIRDTPQYAEALSRQPDGITDERAVRRAVDEARRALTPGIATVAVWTALTGPFGAISAARRAHRADAVQASMSPYWTTWIAVFGLQLIALSIYLS